MAAILEPHRFPHPAPTRRPDLQLLPGRGLATRRPPPRVHAGLVAAAVVALLVVMAGSVAIGRGALAGLAPAPPAAASAPAAGPDATTVVVHPGDTLWSIARRVQPRGDVRPLVDRLVAANGSTVVVPGDRVVVPR